MFSLLPVLRLYFKLGESKEAHSVLAIKLGEYDKISQQPLKNCSNVISIITCTYYTCAFMPTHVRTTLFLQRL